MGNSGLGLRQGGRRVRDTAETVFGEWRDPKKLRGANTMGQSAWGIILG
jgi:hypothetical protein